MFQTRDKYKMHKTILVTGGAGFIGSHTCVALAAAGYAPLILDNLDNLGNLGNSDIRVLDRLTRISGKSPRFIEGDVRDRALPDRLFAEQPIAGVIHFGSQSAIRWPTRSATGQANCRQP